LVRAFASAFLSVVQSCRVLHVLTCVDALIVLCNMSRAVSECMLSIDVEKTLCGLFYVVSLISVIVTRLPILAVGGDVTRFAPIGLSCTECI